MFRCAKQLQIEEVRIYFSEEESQDTITPDAGLPVESWLLNTNATPEKEALLGALPARTVVDRLVSRYFNSNTPALRSSQHCYGGRSLISLRHYS